jgi:hypothetical protein
VLASGSSHLGSGRGHRARALLAPGSLYGCGRCPAGQPLRLLAMRLAQPTTATPLPDSQAMLCPQVCAAVCVVLLRPRYCHASLPHAPAALLPGASSSCTRANSRAAPPRRCHCRCRAHMERPLRLHMAVVAVATPTRAPDSAVVAALPNRHSH